MVVHGYDFIIAGSCDDFGWSSHKLNEKRELVQRAIFGTRIRQRGSGVESLCDVQRVRNDVGTRYARVAKLGLQSARQQTSPGGAKPNAPLNREELESDGQKANHTVSAGLAHVAPDRPDIALACAAAQTSHV